jgi:hypothetical protein
MWGLSNYSAGSTEFGDWINAIADVKRDFIEASRLNWGPEW